jgi:hypothetical protein
LDVTAHHLIEHHSQSSTGPSPVSHHRESQGNISDEGRIEVLMGDCVPPRIQLTQRPPSHHTPWIIGINFDPKVNVEAAEV